MKNKSLYSSSKSTWVLSLAVFKVKPTLLGETKSLSDGGEPMRHQPPDVPFVHRMNHGL
jgi:hypothetical protein